VELNYLKDLAPRVVSVASLMIDWKNDCGYVVLILGSLYFLLLKSGTRFADML
jgi:hypothetical protein